MSAILTAHQLSHRYARRIIFTDVSLTLHTGEAMMITGPNGAGKSTLLALLCGLYQPQVGSVLLFGRPPAPVGLARTGVLFQGPTIDPDLTVVEALALHAGLHGFSAHEGRARAEDALTILSVAHLHDRLCRTLSGGERRRIELARTIMHRPELLILDEPTAGLDPSIAHSLLAMLAKRCGTLLWTSHISGEAFPGTRVLHLDNGRLQ